MFDPRGIGEFCQPPDDKAAILSRIPAARRGISLAHSYVERPGLSRRRTRMEPLAQVVSTSSLPFPASARLARRGPGSPSVSIGPPRREEIADANQQRYVRGVFAADDMARQHPSPRGR